MIAGSFLHLFVGKSKVQGEVCARLLLSDALMAGGKLHEVASFMGGCFFITSWGVQVVTIEHGVLMDGPSWLWKISSGNHHGVFGAIRFFTGNPL